MNQNKVKQNKRKQNRRVHIQDDEVNISEDGMSYHMIAKILGISVQEVKNIEYQALRKLKTPNEKNRKLRDYLMTKLKPEQRIDE